MIKLRIREWICFILICSILLISGCVSNIKLTKDDVKLLKLEVVNKTQADGTTFYVSDMETYLAEKQGLSRSKVYSCLLIDDHMKGNPRLKNYTSASRPFSFKNEKEVVKEYNTFMDTKPGTEKSKMSILLREPEVYKFQYCCVIKKLDYLSKDLDFKVISNEICSDEITVNYD
jgi:hypothetical protein